ncbi:hypothetical protein [Streptomyces hydrogenans]|uniref:hypothetical protein n=1 Tax=Streptomyces hydrogenans TaxID=1873719 RepID=UPI0035DC21D7
MSIFNAAPLPSSDERQVIVHDDDGFAIWWDANASEKDPGLGLYTVCLREFHTAMDQVEALEMLPDDASWAGHDKAAGWVYTQWHSRTPPTLPAGEESSLSTDSVDWVAA